MQRWLISLYPKQWRQQYGDEYGALLEDVGLSPAVAADTIRAACFAQLRQHQKIVASAIAIGLYTTSGYICLQLGLTANWPLWAPTRPARAAGLLITLLPILFIAYLWLSPIYQQLRARHERHKAIANFLLVLPFSLTTIIFSALTGGSFLLALGLSWITIPNSQLPPETHAWGDARVVGAAMVRLMLLFAIVPLGILVVKVLIALQRRLLERLTA